MPFQYTILGNQSLILVRFDGPLCVAEFTASAAAICSDQRYVRGMDGVIDLSTVDVHLGVKEIKELIEFTMKRKKHGQGKWAVLVTHPIATAYMMLYQQGVKPEHPFSIFSSYEGVSSFLGRPIDEKFLDAALAA